MDPLGKNKSDAAGPAKGGVREVAGVALPMVVSFACETVMTFTDRWFLARLAPELMNAAMLGGLTAFMMLTFAFGLCGYATAIVARFYGAGDKPRCSVALAQALLAALAAYPLIVAAKPLAHAFFAAAGLPEAQLAPQTLYFDLLVNASILSLARHCFASFFSGIGRTRVVMLASLLVMGVNILANYALIYGNWGAPAMGIRGAAYGTIAGAACGVAVLAWALFRRANRREFAVSRAWRFDASVMGALLRFGYPAGLEMFLNVLAFNSMVLFFHAAGARVATAATVVFNWDMVSFVPLLGAEIGVTSLVGRYLGARDPQTARKAAFSGLRLALGYSAVIFVLFAVFPGALAEVFRPSAGEALFDAAKPTAEFMIRIASLYVLVQAMFVVFIGALRGAGDTHWAMRFTVAVHWMLVPASWWILHGLRFSAEAAWTALVLIFLASAVFPWRRFQAGNWQHIRMMPEDPAAAAMVHDDFHEGADL